MAKPESPLSGIHMAQRQQQQVNDERMRRRKRRLYQRLVIIGMAFVVIFGVMTLFHLKQRTVQADLQNNYEELNEELTGLQQQKDNLKEEIDLLNDEEYILDIARTNYFLSKKGELIFQTDNQDERAY